MATSTTTLTTAWTAVCNSTQTFLLTLINPGDTVEVATTDDGTDPVITAGHRLEYAMRSEGKDSISRTVIGPGYVFAKAINPASLAVVINAWEDALVLFSAGLWDTSATWLNNRFWS